MASDLKCIEAKLKETVVQSDIVIPRPILPFSELTGDMKVRIKMLATRTPEQMEVVRRTMAGIDLDLFAEAERSKYNNYEMNQSLVNELKKLPLPNSTRLASINRAQADQIYNEVSRTYGDFVEIDLRRFDPENRVGFCFGRALVFHIDALSRRIDRQSVRKIWAVGPIESPIHAGEIWNYHVATMIRSSDGSWWVFDPALFASAAPLDLWVENIQSRATSGQLLIFSTQAERNFPSPGTYQRAELSSAHYSNYYKELLQNFRTQFRKRRRR